MKKDTIYKHVAKVRLIAGYVFAWLTVISIWMFGQELIRILYICPLISVNFVLMAAFVGYALLSLYVDKIKRYMERPARMAIKISFIVMAAMAFICMNPEHKVRGSVDELLRRVRGMADNAVTETIESDSHSLLMRKI